MRDACDSLLWLLSGPAQKLPESRRGGRVVHRDSTLCSRGQARQCARQCQSQANGENGHALGTRTHTHNRAVTRRNPMTTQDNTRNRHTKRRGTRHATDGTLRGHTRHTPHVTSRHSTREGNRPTDRSPDRQTNRQTDQSHARASDQPIGRTAKDNATHRTASRARMLRSVWVMSLLRL